GRGPLVLQRGDVPQHVGAAARRDQNGHRFRFERRAGGAVRAADRELPRLAERGPLIQRQRFLEAVAGPEDERRAEDRSHDSGRGKSDRLRVDDRPRCSSSNAFRSKLSAPNRYGGDEPWSNDVPPTLVTIKVMGTSSPTRRSS